MQGIKGVQRPQSIKTGGAAKSKKKATVSMGGETVHLANAESLREQAKIMLADMPEVRLQRIEEIRNALEQGNYHLEGKKVARRIVINALAEGPWQY